MLEKPALCSPCKSGDHGRCVGKKRGGVCLCKSEECGRTRGPKAPPPRGKGPPRPVGGGRW
jgi:hypothetical protein